MEKLSIVRTCNACGKELKKKPKERYSDWKVRRNCDFRCAGISKRSKPGSLVTHERTCKGSSLYPLKCSACKEEIVKGEKYLSNGGVNVFHKSCV